MPDFQEFTETNYGYGSASEVIMNLTLKEAARGVNKDTDLNVVDRCPKCQGSGAELGTKAVKCPHCSGTGMQTISTGPFVMRSTCRYCVGKGTYIKHPCGECHGKGQTVQRRTITVPVPAGVEDGQTVRMAVGSKEVFITFRIAKSDYYRRDGADIHTDVDVSIAQSLLGGTVLVHGIYEDINLKVPSGTSSHTRIRIPHKGIRRVNSYGYGDHYVHVKIQVPYKLDQKSKALITAYAELEKDTPGTIDGMTQTKDGKVCMKTNDLLDAIRSVIDDNKPVSRLTQSDNTKDDQFKPHSEENKDKSTAEDNKNEFHTEENKEKSEVEEDKNKTEVEEERERKQKSAP